MAAFATMVAAEIRAGALQMDGTWTQAHAGVSQGGVICIRVQRKMTTPVPDSGGWVEIFDDATV